MKKLIAISLLVIHSFNLAGSGLVAAYFIRQSDERLVANLDNGKYQESLLVEIKIPLHVPYMQSSPAYERTDGTLEHDGVQYNYVKRRIFNDTLSILCIPNTHKTAVVKQSRQLSNELNDFPAGKKQKSPGIKKSGMSADYCSLLTDYSVEAVPAPAITRGTYYNQLLLPANLLLPERPPCFIA